MPSGSWRDDAACQGMGVDLFFPNGSDWAPARRVCDRCPVAFQCLEFALRQPDDWYGMFGGKTPRERDAIRWARRTRSLNQRTGEP